MYERKIGNVSIVCFPKVITDILSCVLNVKFTRPDHIPKQIFNATDECKSAFLQALFDDEGCSSNGIVIRMKSYNFMREVRNIIEQIGIKTNKLFQSNDMASLSINGKYVELFKEKIGFSHPLKIRNLNAIINRRHRKERTRDIEGLKKQILIILKNKSLPTIEIANNIQLTLGHTLTYLKTLEKETKISRSGFKNKLIWSISMA